MSIDLKIDPYYQIEHTEERNQKTTQAGGRILTVAVN